MNRDIDYSGCFSSPESLANAVLEQYEEEFGKLEFPINPFKILKSLNVKLVLRNFKKLEGLYLPARNNDDIELVAINNNRPLYRQRFTAAHEICHFIKDRKNLILCPKAGKKSDIEMFADKFAACLLMPIRELNNQVNKYINENGNIPLEKVINVSEYFGVSFESCVYNIAYRLNKIEGETESKELKKRISKIKPEKLRKQFGISNHLKLTREFIDFCTITTQKENSATYIKFEQFLVLNENRLEGVDISAEKINYILADIRLNNNVSKYQEEQDFNILEAVGNIEMLGYVLKTDEKIDVWKMSKLQKLLYKYTPFGNELEFPRRSNNRIHGAKVSTVDSTMIFEELIKVDKQIQELVENKAKLSVHEYVLEAIKIHYRLTVIHPLNDGNGRCSRAMLLWLLRLKKIPPIYIKSENKAEYIDALNRIDKGEGYDYLELFILQQITNSMVLFDEKLVLDTRKN